MAVRMWDSRRCPGTVRTLQWGGCGDVLKARREGKEFGELGRAKYKVREVIEESV